MVYYCSAMAAFKIRILPSISVLVSCKASLQFCLSMYYLTQCKSSIPLSRTCSKYHMYVCMYVCIIQICTISEIQQSEFIKSRRLFRSILFIEKCVFITMCHIHCIGISICMFQTFKLNQRDDRQQLSLRSNCMPIVIFFCFRNVSSVKANGLPGQRKLKVDRIQGQIECLRFEHIVSAP